MHTKKPAVERKSQTPYKRSTTNTTIVLAAVIILTSTSCMAHAPSPSIDLPSEPEPAMPLGPCAPATNECFTLVSDTLECLSSMEESSKVMVLDKNCCTKLAAVMYRNPMCLCEMLSNVSSEASFGIQIAMNRALNLSSVCGVNMSTCSEVGYQVSSLLPNESPGVQPLVGLLASNSSSENNEIEASKAEVCAQSSFICLQFLFLLTLFY